ncbi:hypothetical protein HYS90_01670, partial [Candidatus Curtissbacteria bacterium]|nr:hypothetical protein [Candidatus Curtissbacteria bacterium]
MGNSKVKNQKSKLKEWFLRVARAGRGVTRLERLPLARSSFGLEKEPQPDSEKRALVEGKVVAGPRATGSKLTGPAYLPGQILIIAVIFLAVILILSGSLFSVVTNFLRFGSNSV